MASTTLASSGYSCHTTVLTEEAEEAEAVHSLSTLPPLLRASQNLFYQELAPAVGRLLVANNVEVIVGTYCLPSEDTLRLDDYNESSSLDHHDRQQENTPPKMLEVDLEYQRQGLTQSRGHYPSRAVVVDSDDCEDDDNSSMYCSVSERLYEEEASGGYLDEILPTTPPTCKRRVVNKSSVTASVNGCYDDDSTPPTDMHEWDWRGGSPPYRVSLISCEKERLAELDRMRAEAELLTRRTEA